MTSTATQQNSTRVSPLFIKTYESLGNSVHSVSLNRKPKKIPVNGRVSNENQLITEPIGTSLKNQQYRLRLPNLAAKKLREFSKYERRDIWVIHLFQFRVLKLQIFLTFCFLNHFWSGVRDFLKLFQQLVIIPRCAPRAFLTQATPDSRILWAGTALL